jgi:RNA polymerase sigma-B factor
MSSNGQSSERAFDPDASGASAELNELFARRNDPDARRLIVARYDRLATRLARRYRGRGEPVDDLEQVARVGLVNALDRFDPERGVQFSTFATRTILGELKRHLRDRTWSVRVPRSLQERWLESSRAIEDLTHSLSRSPTITEIAARIDATEDEVLEALDAGSAYTAGSLDLPLGDDDESGRLIDLLGAEDPDLVQVAPWTTLTETIGELPERERRILYLRFFEGRTQSEIGDQLGISQMHVSRLLRRALETLRDSPRITGA